MTYVDFKPALTVALEHLHAYSRDYTEVELECMAKLARGLNMVCRNVLKNRRKS
jgi:hypothetical protein